ncbi:MAG TPA: hypothetical protein VJM33_11255 [Microthrixaceae bacterium]|nr:hypothetical protein [Microthrixaceae bacterium]
MTVAVRLAGFATLLVVVFVGSWAVGAAVGPLDTQEPPAHVEHTP